MTILEDNIFDLLGKGTTVYHSAILTSFTFDPYYFSNYYMPQMRSRGIKNVVVLIDSTQYDAILEDTETFKSFRHDIALIRVKKQDKRSVSSKGFPVLGRQASIGSCRFWKPNI